MGIGISYNILRLVGQRVNEIKLDEVTQQVNIVYRRDRRKKVVDPVTGLKGTVNRYVSRDVRDIPFMGYPCILKIELA
jgi:transposase